MNLHNFAEERAAKDKEIERQKNEKLANKIANMSSKRTSRPAYKGASASDVSVKEENEGNDISIISAEDAMKVILHL